MTNELEKQFFDTFGIEPKTNQVYGIKLYYHIEKYPQITDRILLELICLISQHITYIDTIEKLKTIEELKTWILEEVIYQYEHYGFNNTIKHQVRTLFEEG